MLEELKRFLVFMRPAFSRRATYCWFVIVFVGFILRSDSFGVSSIVRALALAPGNYICLLHFFHSTAWNVETIMPIWWQWLVGKKVAHRIGNRLVLIGDHTKTPKDGRKMPAVTTLHQDSETARKPSFFRGHHWGCIGMLVQAYDKYFAIPLWANIQEGLALSTDSADRRSLSKTVQIVEMAKQITLAMGTEAYLVLDAYFAVGPVFLAAAQELNGISNFVHILTRAKKNVVAYCKPPARKKHKRGRPREYGKKLKLAKLFDSKAKCYTFQTIEANIYNQSENIRYLVLDLIWKPVKGMLRFILVETSRGRIILMTSDLNLDPVTAIQIYCRRVTIETMFDTLKNTLSAMAYHFWSQYLRPASRRPKKKKDQKQNSLNPMQTQNTLAAIEKFVNVQLLVLGMLQLIAKQFPVEVKAKANCWLRTVSTNTPSEFVTRTALSNILKNNLYGFGKDWITQLIRQKQISRKNKAVDKKVA
ncbi:MAG: transposase [Planctomycetes bacterium]|nr:transposase [Planctomycetota bacterium]